VDAADDNGNTPLGVASVCGKLDAARALLAGGASVNTDSRGWTALHAASYSGSEDIVRVLLAAGASVDARSSALTTPLHHASMQNHLALAAALLAAGADRTLLDINGNTALIYAKSDAMRALLAA
jgi:ankyrin repeat protein